MHHAVGNLDDIGMHAKHGAKRKHYVAGSRLTSQCAMRCTVHAMHRPSQARCADVPEVERLRTLPVPLFFKSVVLWLLRGPPSNSTPLVVLSATTLDYEDSVHVHFGDVIALNVQGCEWEKEGENQTDLYPGKCGGNWERSWTYHRPPLCLPLLGGQHRPSASAA